MDKKVKQSWVKALRSGKYKKAKEALRKKDKFCCLSVLCDLYSKTHKNVKWEKDENEYYFLNCKENLPDKIIEWSGLNSYNPTVSIKNVIGGELLTSLNDDYGYSFKKIADLIEEQL